MMIRTLLRRIKPKKPLLKFAAMKSVLLAFAFVASAVAVPLEPTRGQCARHCTETKKFNYDPGRTYVYDYESHTVTTLQGTASEKSQLYIKAQVEIEALSKCDFSLQLRRVSLEQSDPKNPGYRRIAVGTADFRRELEQNTLRFSFQDGTIDTLCPTENEPTWVLNIKRGVLSAFQTSMNDLFTSENTTETDVAGKCEVEYMAMGRGWYKVNVEKRKNLLTCVNRESIDSAMQTTPYNSDVPKKSLPLLKGTQNCEQSFSNDKLYSVTCTEQHVFKPFSNHDKSAVTKSIQTLTFNSQRQGSFTGNDYRPTRHDLLFDHGYSEPTNHVKGREAEQTLVDICEAARHDIRPSVPAKFARLVYKLRELDYQSLYSIYQRADSICNGNKNSRQFITDAIPVVGSTASIRLIRELITKKEISDAETDMWLSSMAFVAKPTAEMIGELVHIIDGTSGKAILYVSSLAHTFCRTHSECGSVPEVQRLVRRLVEKLGNKCIAQDSQTVLLSLKAIGNIGVDDGVMEAIEDCYSNPQLDTEIRLTAIQAYRRFSCSVSRDNLVKIYTTYNENIEVRIAAYMAVMRCPSFDVINNVKETLEKEVAKQVGSFVWTHLTNMQKTSHPFKEDVRQILMNVHFMNKFNSDIRKFSRYFEGSFFMDTINTGVHVDGDVIFTPESYLPRSGMVNFTVDVFGNSLNLFEIGGRMQGMEELVERFFGPEGYFPQTNIEKMLKKVRGKRSTKDNIIDKLSAMYKSTSESPKDTSGSIYMKVFGNEVFYSRFEEFESMTPGRNLLDMLLKLAKEQDVELTKSFMFLDTTYTIPTSSGLPLRLAVNGTATVGLKMGGKFDIRSIRHVDVHGHFQPSGAVEISTLMTVDANVAQSGLKVAAVLHSSTVMDGLVEVKDGKLLHVQMNVPRDNIEIVDIESKIYLVHGGEKQEQKGRREDRTEVNKCTSKYLGRMIGMELCGEMSFPVTDGRRSDAFLSPLSGPASIKLLLRKTDPTLESYNFEANFRSEKVGTEKYIRRVLLSFNTPHSTVDREMTLDIQLNQQENSFDFKLRSPIKKFEVNAKYNNDEMEKKVDLRITMDNKEQLSFITSLRTEKSRKSLRLLPYIEIKIPNRRLVFAKGYLALVSGEKYSGQLTIQDLTEKPILLKGDVDVSNHGRFEGEIEISSYILDTTVKGNIDIGSGVITKLSVDYQVLGGKRENFDITGKFRNFSANSLTKYTGAITFQSTAVPDYTTVLSLEMQNTDGHLENVFDVSCGDGRRGKIHRMKLQQLLHYEGSLADSQISASLKFEYPQRSIDYALILKHIHNANSLSSSLNLKYSKEKEIISSIKLSKKHIRFFQLRADAQLKYPGREMRLTGEVIENNGNDYHVSIDGHWQESQMKVIANYKNKSNQYKLGHEVDVEIVLPRTTPVSAAGYVSAAPGDYAIAINTEVAREKYRVQIDYSTSSLWNHKFSGIVSFSGGSYSTVAAIESNQNTVKGNIDVNLKGIRRILGNFDLKNTDVIKTGSLDLKWDADRNQEKRIIIDSEYQHAVSRQTGTINVKILKRTIKASFNNRIEGHLTKGPFTLNTQGDLEWEPGRKINMDLKADYYIYSNRRKINTDITFITPFDGFQKGGVHLSHSDDGEEWKNNLVVKQNSRQTKLTSEGRYRISKLSSYLQGSVKFNNPNMRQMQMDIYHNMDSSDISNRLEVQWEYNRKISASVFGSLLSAGIRGGVNFTSPFASFRAISASILHTQDQNHIQSQAEFQWDVKKKIAIEFDGKLSLTNNKHTVTIKTTAITPFTGFESALAKIFYSNDGKNVKIDTEVNWNYNRVLFGMQGSNKNTYYNTNVNGKIYFTSSFRGYENMDISGFCEIYSHSFKSNIEARLPTRKKASFSTEVKIRSSSDANIQFLVTTPFRNFELISLDLSHKFTDSLKTVGKIRYRNQEITMHLSGSNLVSYNGQRLDAALVFTTPFVGYEKVKLTIAHDNNQLDRFNSHLEASKNQDSLQLIHRFTIQNAYNFQSELEIFTPFESLKSVKTTTEQSFLSSSFKHNTNFIWNRQTPVGIIIEFLSDRQTYEQNIQARIKLTTPSDILQSLLIETTFENNNHEYKPRFNIKWNDSKQITLTGRLASHGIQQVEGNIIYTSPFYGYEKITLSGKYDLASRKRTGELSVEYDPRNNGKVFISGSLFADRRKGEADIVFKSPISNFEELAVYGKYTSDKNPKSAEVSLQWPGDQKIKIYAEFSQEKDNFETSISFTSAFRGYKPFHTEAKANIRQTQGNFQITITWGLQDKIEFSSDYEITSNMLSTTLILRTSFQGYEDIVLNGRLQNKHNEIDVFLTTTWSPGKKISVMGNVKHNDFYPTELTTNIETPFLSYRNIKLSSTIENVDNEFSMKTLLNWNSKTYNMNVLFSKQDLEAKLNINMPNPNHKISIEGRFNGINSQKIEGSIKFTTPFETISPLEVTGNLLGSEKGKQISIIGSSRNSRFYISGDFNNYKNRQITGNLKADLPFLKFSNIDMNLNINSDWINQFDASVRMTIESSAHTAKVVLRNLELTRELLFEIQSSLLPTKQLTLELQLASKPNAYNTVLRFYTPYTSHRFTGSIQKTRQKLSIEGSLESPVVENGLLRFSAIYRSERFERTKLDVILDTKLDKHSLQMAYEYGKDIIVISGNVESKLLKSRSIEIECKYINNNDRELETSFKLTTPYSIHTASGILKLYDTEIEIIVSIQTPVFDVRSLTVTSSFVNKNFEVMEGNVLIRTPKNEIRVAGNIRNSGWKGLEAFFTINTPFDILKMVRTDIKLLNENFKNIEGSLEIQTSTYIFPKMSVAGKFRHNPGMYDISINSKLPIQRYHSIRLLTTLHYNRDLTFVNPRFTLTLPQKQYSFFSIYKISGQELRATLGYEWNQNSQIQFSTSIKFAPGNWNSEFAVTTPFHGYEYYNFGITYTVEQGHYNIRITFKGPQDGTSLVDGSFRFFNLTNMKGDITINTPFRGLETIATNFLVQDSSEMFLSSFQHSWGNNQRIVFNFHNKMDSEGNSGMLKITSPFQIIRKANIEYNVVNKNDMKIEMEITYNNQKVLKVQTSSIYESWGYHRYMNVELPLSAIHFSLDAKSLENGIELKVVSNIPSRKVIFHTIYQNTWLDFSHATEFTWDAEARRTISYEARLVESSKRGLDFFGKLSLPSRSIELKGETEPLQSGKHINIEFLWDAAKDTNKRIGLGFEYRDKSKRDITAHKLQMTFKYPRLPKEIVILGDFSVSSSEFYMKTEVDYSRYSQNNMVAEIRVRNIQSWTESKYMLQARLKHPVSNLDTSCSGHIVNNNDEYVFNVKFGYLDRNRIQRVQELMVKFMKLQQKINFQMKDSVNQLKIFGRMFNRDHEFTAALEQQLNDHSPFHSHFRFSKRYLNVELNITTPENDGIYVRIALPEDAAHFEINHINKGSVVSDVLFDLGLEEFKVLRSHISWRPEMLDDIKQVVSKHGDINNMHASIIDDVSSEVFQEFNAKSTMLKSSVAQELKPFYQEMEQDFASLQHELILGSEEVYKMYRKNDFYIKDIIGGIEAVANSVGSIISSTGEALKNGVFITGRVFTITFNNISKQSIKILETIVDLYGRIFYGVVHIFRKFSLNAYEWAKPIVSYVTDVATELSRVIQRDIKWFIRHYTPFIEHYCSIIGNTYSEVMETIRDSVDYLIEEIYGHPYYIALNNYVYRIKATFAAFRHGYYSDLYNNIKEDTMTSLSSLATHYSEFHNHPHVEYIKDLSRDIYNKGTNTARYFGVDDIISESYIYLKKITLESVKVLIEDWTSMIAGISYTFKPEQGQIGFSFELPVSRQSLLDVLDVSSYPTYQHLQDFKYKLFSGYFHLLDGYYSVIRLLNPQNWTHPSTVQCETYGGTTLLEGESTVIRNMSLKTAHIVFIIEEKVCNKDVIPMLDKLARGADRNYRQKGYSDVRYTVVGFGGDGIHGLPHLHTSNGEVFTSIRSFDSAITSLAIGNGPNNIFHAIRFATDLPFNVGATKTFVLVKCSTCESEDEKDDYGEIMQILLDNEITLHLLMDHEFQMKSAIKSKIANRLLDQLQHYGGW
ncbi:uncharacterized protein LOC143242367 isoform X2 [Tachypleus tridentatus]|uniref:uncharacterized protein LOC143242367 isoform X2 n=1 Tax=Tachypleus tridentatus TaxID=6853 RepID=UPI003FD10D95